MEPSAFRRVRTLQRHLTSAPPLPFNPDEVTAKYNTERDARLRRRPEGTNQYKHVDDYARTDPRFANMLLDPWTHVTPRDTKHDEVEVAIIGAGYGGLLAGAHLVQQGIDSSTIRVVDTAGDVGGTWYWNRYPGAMCDVESYTYMPLLEELEYTPTEKYAHQPELHQHSRMIAHKYGLYQNALFSTQCSGLKWEEELKKWRVMTVQGDSFLARFVFMNFGTLTRPKLPGVPGVDTFKGHMMHTSRWDYEYTGGDSLGHLNKLNDKRVAIIGTGATSIQAVPHLGKHAKKLYVFQRTPSSVDVRGNRPTTKEFADKFLSTPGWQQERMNNFTIMTQSNQIGIKDLIQDGWTKIMRNLNQEFLAKRRELMKVGAGPKAMKIVSEMAKIADMKQMHEVRQRASSIVRDKKTAEALQPWYPQFCKRPCFHDEYLPTFNLPNVELVHNVAGVDAITSNGVVCGGVEYPVDLIVFATGFEIGYDVLEPGYNIVGRNEVSIRQKWKNGPRTFCSMHTHGFPNLIMQNAPQGTFTTNFVQKLEEEAKHAACMIKALREKGMNTFDAALASENAWCERIWKNSERGQKFFQKCTPGYYNREGAARKGKHLSAAYSVPINFFEMLKERREKKEIFQGMVLE